MRKLRCRSAANACTRSGAAGGTAGRRGHLRKRAAPGRGHRPGAPALAGARRPRGSSPIAYRWSNAGEAPYLTQAPSPRSPTRPRGPRSAGRRTGFSLTGAHALHQLHPLHRPPGRRAQPGGAAGALSDFLLQSGFAGGPHHHPYWGEFGDEDRSLDALKEALLRALIESGQLTPEMLWSSTSPEGDGLPRLPHAAPPARRRWASSSFGAHDTPHLATGVEAEAGASPTSSATR
jgi:hypothetical protein